MVGVARVIVVGSANVDHVWRGTRLPAPGETVTDGEYVRVFGGKGANQAAARLGAETHLVACVGADDLGDAVRADLVARGVDCSCLSRSESAPTGVALINVDARGENTVAVAPGANHHLVSAEAVAAVDALARPGDVVLCSLELEVGVVVAALGTARRRGATTVLNPAPVRPGVERCVANCSVVVPNEHEARQLGDADALLAAGAGAVVVTLGANGAIVHRAGVRNVTVAGFAVDALDTTGAGDAYCGALAWSLAGGAPLEVAVRRACAAGALASRALGAREAQATAAEVLALAG